MSVHQIGRNEQAFAALFKQFLAAHEEHENACHAYSKAEDALSAAKRRKSSPAKIKQLGAMVAKTQRATDIACDAEAATVEKIAAKRALSLYGIAIKLRVYAYETNLWIPTEPPSKVHRTGFKRYLDNKLAEAVWQDAERLIEAAQL